MVIGSAKALQQHMVKRVIAYSSIAQIGYIFMGIGMGNQCRAGSRSTAHDCPRSDKAHAVYCRRRPHGLLRHQKGDSGPGGARRNWAAGAGLVVGKHVAMIGIPFFPGLFPIFCYGLVS